MTIPERIISGDSHLEVSPERWQSYVAREFHEWVPKVVQLPDGGDAWKVPGSRVEVPLGLNFGAGLGPEGLKTRGISYRDNPAGSGDSAQRLREMDQDGVEAELLFPAVAGARSLGNRLPREAHVAVIQGYNNWLSREFTAADPKRLLGVAMLPATTAEDAADEVRRVAGMPGIRTAVLHLWPNGSQLPIPDEDALFWSTVVDLDFPMSVHFAFGGGEKAEAASSGIRTGQNSVLVNGALTRPGGLTPFCVTQLITSGTFDRFPGLRIAFAESGAGWIPYYMQEADNNFERHRHYSKLELAHEPSWYVPRHFMFNFQDDFCAIQNRRAIGVENLTWGTDFPHSATNWPHSRKLVEALCSDLNEEEARSIFGGNVARFYRLDEEAPA